MSVIPLVIVVRLVVMVKIINIVNLDVAHIQPMTVRSCVKVLLGATQVVPVPVIAKVSSSIVQNLVPQAKKELCRAVEMTKPHNAHQYAREVGFL